MESVAVKAGWIVELVVWSGLLVDGRMDGKMVGWKEGWLVGLNCLVVSGWFQIGRESRERKKEKKSGGKNTSGRWR